MKEWRELRKIVEHHALPNSVNPWSDLLNELEWTVCEEVKQDW